MLSKVITILFVLIMVMGGVQSQSTLFKQCIDKVDSRPVNVIWQDGFHYLESTRSQNIIGSVMGLVGEKVLWDSAIGPHYPEDIKSRVDETLSVGLSDGTLVSFIINLQTETHLYGWLTFSTYHTSASYNPTPNPHVHCGFWSIEKTDRSRLRDLFRGELQQNRLFEFWMR